MFTNRYIFIYSSVMVIVVAAILSSAAEFLKPMQQKNIRTAKIMNILGSVDIPTEKSVADATYTKYIVEEYTVSREGEVLSSFINNNMESGTVRAFDIDLKAEQKKLKDLNAGAGAEEPAFPMFVCNKDGEKFFVIPMLGTGLWGPIWGNIALKDDFKTVVGVNFGHAGETPGLGAEISTPMFSNQFLGKTIFDENYSFKSIKVVKGGIGTMPAAEQIHGVDAIAGGTITSNGVTAMINDCLINYVPYIKKQI
ncbi:MAG: NADH:ubiquinone reductase (Na(+)-transporting) subunit C [Bacteroidales bacterium]|nr:NADH:ubiquinone reductase (Na(+)-transporting) subunit C [Bacteroidales bacterium]MCF8404064.1 NADH:ubiquinone reductase (Na(+)-transporting) subunit C [Bacteroidales bacterium]